ncbi:hypothetical protein [Actinoallomurus acaciae]|uniref:Uncharacterized protein n=1 Tax=Actinoallomurus acaciae TaxID=502577 RepID=A0ABV5Y8V6_9ACTN
MLKRCEFGNSSLAAACSGYFGSCNGDAGCQIQQSFLYGEACSHFKGVCSSQSSWKPFLDALAAGVAAFGFEPNLPEGEEGKRPPSFGVGDTPKKVVNTNISHVDDMRAARAGYEDARSAQDAVRDLSKSIGKDGFPEGTIPDTARSDRLLVPIGNGGLASYQIKPNGNAVFKTILKAR